jgi:integrase
VDTTPTTSITNDLLDLDGGKVALVLDQALLSQLGIGAVKQTKSADDLFEASLYAKDRSERTRNKYRRYWEEFKRYLEDHCEGRDPVCALEQDIVDFIAHQRSDARLVPGQKRGANGEVLLVSHPLQASSIRSVLSCLSAFYSTCVSRRQRFDDPTKGIKRPRGKTRVGATLSDEEVRRILDAPGRERCRVQAYLLLYTAARCESLRFLLWENVDFVKNEIHFDVAKGDKFYTVPMHLELKAALFRWQAAQEKQAAKNPAIAVALTSPETAYVLLTSNGLPLSHSTMSKQFKWRANRAGVRAHAAGALVGRENKSRVSTHWARRTVATSLRRKGVDIAEVADLLNDTVQVVKDHYAGSSTPTQHKVVAKISY